MSTIVSKPLPQVVHEVREYIEKYGWSRDDYSNEQGNVCILGGLAATQLDSSDISSVDDELKLINLLCESPTGMDFYDLFKAVTGNGSIVEWNDQEAADQEHVIQTLKEMEVRAQTYTPSGSTQEAGA